MTPHQALALGVRLFAVWFALITVRDLIAFLGTGPSSVNSQPLFYLMAGFAVITGILLVLWFFPKSIARGLLPSSTDAPKEVPSYHLWFSAGIALLGLWFLASAIAPILRNLSVMYVFPSELTNLEDLRQLRVGILYYLVEFAIGLGLIVGATGIARFVWWVRNAGPR